MNERSHRIMAEHCSAKLFRSAESRYALLPRPRIEIPLRVPVSPNRAKNHARNDQPKHFRYRGVPAVRTSGLDTGIRRTIVLEQNWNTTRRGRSWMSHDTSAI